ncbi:unnamed protein product [Ophioblennius macclurei]
MNFCRFALFLGSFVCVCDGVHVTVRERQRYAMLFQAVVLPCQFQTASSQTPVVQWWYKSYCRDRTRDSFGLPGALGAAASDLGPASHLECSDSSRTVRVVASAQGASMTLAEHYKGRDIAIVNRADLRIGELQWGDSGVYFCKVVIADDLEGKNEAQMELLVLGRKLEHNDLLPEFDVDIMPEWAFVGSVVLGGVLVLLLLGVCWCQCCPHSCCCYLRCCCCPDACCCPRHLYEAGKMAKSGRPAHLPVYPYYVPAVPAVLPVAAPPQLEPKISSLPSLDNNLTGVRSGYRLQAAPHQDSMRVLYYLEQDLGRFPSAGSSALKPASLSELSSLHDGGGGGGGSDFRHAYQTLQMKALPPIADLDDPGLLRAGPSRRNNRRPRGERGNQSDDELDRRWNPRSEHLQRKTLSRRGRTGSLDELEEFARSYGSRGRRAEPPDRRYERDRTPPRRHFRGDEDEDWDRRSPSPFPQKRRGTWDGELGYDRAYLNGVLESKARGRGWDGGAGRAEGEDSDTPSKGSERGKGSDSYCSRSPSARPEDDDPLPPYSEREAERHRYRVADRYRTCEPAARPFCYTRPPPAHTPQGGREDRNRDRNLSAALSRDTLIV